MPYASTSRSGTGRPAVSVKAVAPQRTPGRPAIVRPAAGVVVERGRIFATTSQKRGRVDRLDRVAGVGREHQHAVLPRPGHERRGHTTELRGDDGRVGGAEPGRHRERVRRAVRDRRGCAGCGRRRRVGELHGAHDRVAGGPDRVGRRVTDRRAQHEDEPPADGRPTVDRAARGLGGRGIGDQLEPGRAPSATGVTAGSAAAFGPSSRHTRAASAVGSPGTGSPASTAITLTVAVPSSAAGR